MAKDKTASTLSQADRELIFRTATSRFAKDYGEMFQSGMTDYQLRLALEVSLGIFGGSGSPGKPDVVFTGANLCIWGGWRTVNHVTDRPLFSGKATMAMARSVYGIADPDDDQLPLL